MKEKKKFIHPEIKKEVEQLQEIADALEQLPNEHLIFLKGYLSGLQDASLTDINISNR